MKAKLRWEERDGGFWGFTGGQRVSFVLQRGVGNPDRRWRWTFELTGGKWLGAVEGLRADAASAKRQAEKAFNRWLERAQLVPADQA